MSSHASIGSIIQFSIAKTKEILFPFAFKRWIKILFIIWLAGNATGMGNNLNLPDRSTAPSEVTEETKTQTDPVQTQTATASNELDDTTGIPQTALAGSPAEDGSTSQASPVIIGIGILLALILLLVFLWLNARFNFVFLELMTQRDLSIRTSFQTHKVIGNSYFVWEIGFMLLMLAGFLVLAVLGGLAAGFAQPLLWLVVVPLMVILFLAAGVVGVLVLDFALPIMYQDQISCMEACRKFLALKPAMGVLAIYILVKFGLGILAGVAVGIIGIIVALLSFLIGFVVALPAALVSGAIPMLGPLFTVMGMLFLVVGVLAVLVVLGLVTLPVPIFFRAFALSFLARLAPGYNLLGFSAPSSEIPPSV